MIPRCLAFRAQWMEHRREKPDLQNLPEWKRLNPGFTDVPFQALLFCWRCLYHHFVCFNWHRQVLGDGSRQGCIRVTAQAEAGRRRWEPGVHWGCELGLSSQRVDGPERVQCWCRRIAGKKTACKRQQVRLRGSFLPTRGPH